MKIACPLCLKNQTVNGNAMLTVYCDALRCPNRNSGFGAYWGHLVWLDNQDTPQSEMALPRYVSSVS